MITRRKIRRTSRAGLTLVELMVVIVIISILTAVALPTVRQTLRDQKIPRSVNAMKGYIEEARGNAIRTGRPHGIVLKRFGDRSSVERATVLQVQQCSAPPAYSGDVGTATAYLERDVATNRWYLWFGASQSLSLARTAQEYLNSTVPANATIATESNTPTEVTAAIVRFGDAIVLGHGIGAGGELRIRSFEYRQQGGGAGGGGGGGGGAWPLPGESDAIRVGLDPSFIDLRAFRLLQRYVGRSFPYRIYRAPRVSAAEPLEMIEGTALDMAYSGVGVSGWQFAPAAIARSTATGQGDLRPASIAYSTDVYDFHEVWIIFGSNGLVERIYLGRHTGATRGDPIYTTFSLVDDSVYLLLGRSELVLPEAPLSPDPLEGDLPNLLNSESVWLAIPAGSGEVKISPVNTDDGLQAGDAGNNPALDVIPQATWDQWDHAQRQARLNNAVSASRAGILFTATGAL